MDVIVKLLVGPLELLDATASPLQTLLLRVIQRLQPRRVQQDHVRTLGLLVALQTDGGGKKKKTRYRQRPAEGIEIHPGIERAAADLRTLGGGSLSFEPAQDAGEAEEVAAAQRRQPVLAGRRPRLEADGAGVALALLALGRRGGPRHLGERLHAKKQKQKKKHRRKSLQSCRKDWGDSPGLQSPRRDIVG